MRLCRFELDETILTGFYSEERVVPIDQAAEAFSEATGRDLILPDTEDLFHLLPPDGESFRAARRLADWVETLEDDALDELALPLDEVALRVPVPQPRKMLFLAGNYAEHVAERGGTLAERSETFPYIFMKPITTLTHPCDPIVLPRLSPDHIDWECELGVVIGRTCRNVDEKDALDYVAGYTVVNDVSDRRFRSNPDRKPRERDRFFDWLHGKWHDTFCPVGPCLASTDVIPDPQDLRLRLLVNGEARQDATTAQMIFPVAAVVAFLSQFVTLEPGDLIATGTPGGVGAASDWFLRPGDVVSAWIEGIGTLENPVASDD